MLMTGRRTTNLIDNKKTASSATMLTDRIEAVEFAQLSKKLKLTYKDFFVI
jgi:hypothetical protein